MENNTIIIYKWVIFPLPIDGYHWSEAARCSCSQTARGQRSQQLLTMTSWLVVGEKPLWKMMDESSILGWYWKYQIWMGKFKIWQPNHQPVMVGFICLTKNMFRWNVETTSSQSCNSVVHNVLKKTFQNNFGFIMAYSSNALEQRFLNWNLARSNPVMSSDWGRL